MERIFKLTGKLVDIKTRDKAPSFKIPQALRFNTLNGLSNKMTQTVFTKRQKDDSRLSRRIDGVTFAKANRPEHFIKNSSMSMRAISTNELSDDF